MTVQAANESAEPSDHVSVRLGKLPRKVRLPLRGLMELGQIDAESLETILDAGDLAGFTDHLLGFAAGFLWMKARGIPVVDVVRMAKNQHRRIRLDWSPKRWQAEHDRLSRAETLARLAADNMQYDVSAYRASLPERFSGYLIASSRRLGMEGLRQRHCVASYHNRLLNDECAIAAVFVDHRRWTAQLFRTDNPEQPLRLGPIKSRFNASPTPEIRSRIHEILEIPESKPNPVEDIGEARHFYSENLQRALPVLRALGIESVTVEFDGSGDSGSIQGINYEPHPFDGSTRPELEIVCVESEFMDGRWIRRRVERNRNLDDGLEAITDDYLSFAGVNWYDGDGGFGHLTIDVEAGTAELVVNTRYTDTNTEFLQELEIETGVIL